MKTRLVIHTDQHPGGRLSGRSRWAYRQAGTPDFAWQRNYYEHVVRDEESLNRIRQYILDNPARWEFDRENQAAKTPEPEDAWSG